MLKRLKVGYRARLLVRAMLNATILPLSRFSPRDNKLWVFGHQGGKFTGNPKYLFLWLHQNRPDVRAVWFSEAPGTRAMMRRAGFDCVSRSSMAGIWAALRASVYVFSHSISDITEHYFRGAYLVNLWHGVGIKTIMLGHKGGFKVHYQKYRRFPFSRLVFLEYYVDADVISTTSQFMQRHFSRQFQMPLRNFPQLGYPRQDACDDACLRALAISLDEANDCRPDFKGAAEVYLYMPTWRDTGRPFLESALPDLRRLSEAVSQREGIFYVKLHPNTKMEALPHYSNIRYWPLGADVYPYLKEVTCLITDYSSVLYDYLQVKRTGVVLYVFDEDVYFKTDRAMAYPFDENTAGVRVVNFSDLCLAISSGRALAEDPFASEIRAKFWGDGRTGSCIQVVAYIEKRLLSARSSIDDDMPKTQESVEMSK